MTHTPTPVAACIAALLIAGTTTARADAVTDWNTTAGALVAAAKLGAPPATRVMAMVQTAVHDAVRAAARADVSMDAAVAAANRAVLIKLLPAQEAALVQAYERALATVPDGAARTAGIAAGEQAAAAVLARRAGDVIAPERYRPQTVPGVYVPTTAPGATQWPQRLPWTMTSTAQFRPGPPPALSSAQWARDYEEVKTLGNKASSARSAEQTAVAQFWQYSLPPIYHGVLQSVAAAPGRSAAQNARLFAMASQAMDDALIAVFEAKYQHPFWRPLTAIRNGDSDGHDATQPDAGWSPLIDTPLHPEYPSAHAVLAGSVAAVIEAETGGKLSAPLRTRSPSAEGAERRWHTPAELAREVADSRIWAGIHYRTSVETGLAMGAAIGAQAAARFDATAPALQAAATAGR